jgi:acetyltransferase-like isoleucine patch superfamily enzyme
MFNFMNKDGNYASYKIGKGTFGSPKIEKWKINSGNLEIGNFCSFARGVTIFLGGDHHTEWVTTSVADAYFGIRGYPQCRTDGDVIIGNDVWALYVGVHSFGKYIYDRICTRVRRR